MTPDDSMQHNQGHLTRQWMVMQSANQVKHISAILRYDPTGLKCGAARPTLCSQEARTNRSTRLAGFQNTAGLPCRILMLLGYMRADSTRCALKLLLPFHRNKNAVQPKNCDQRGRESDSTQVKNGRSRPSSASLCSGSSSCSCSASRCSCS